MFVLILLPVLILAALVLLIGIPLVPVAVLAAAVIGGSHLLRRHRAEQAPRAH